jgi:arsenate reductase
MKRALVICTGNSCRSQMAEALWKDLGAGRWEVFSAGSKPAGHVHPMAVKVMAEAGVDISAHRSKHLEEFVGEPFDVVVTVCDGASESCPVFPGTQQTLHWPFRDPADAEGGEDERLAVFRAVRDEIRRRIEEYLKELRSI